jgi:hypothetical protein
VTLRKLTRQLLRSIHVGFRLYWLCRPSRRKDILLCCNMALAADYLGSFWELFRHDPRLRFHVVFLCSFLRDHSDSDIQQVHNRLAVPVTRRFWACARPWDLVVCPDHCLPDGLRQLPAVFIGHGHHNKSCNGGTVTYTYGKYARDEKGRVVYTRIFEERETSRDLALRTDPALKDVLVVVGSLENDRLLEQVSRREEFRRQLGYEREDVVVLVLSTWGEHCLLHTMGDELLAEARRLQPEFKFIFSAHPHEYRPQPGGKRVWGEYLRSQRVHGFTVREPSQSWIPYLVASDIVVTDHTGLVENAALLEKPIIMVPVPEDRVWKHSVTWKIRQFVPILRDATMLRECLLRARTDYPRERLHELARTVHPHRGEAAERIRREIYALLRLPPPE